MWTTVPLDAMRLVTTHTHVNYKLLVLYIICYRVYTEITNNKLYVKWTTLPLASSTTTLLSTIYLNESRYVDTDSITCRPPTTTRYASLGSQSKSAVQHSVLIPSLWSYTIAWSYTSDTTARTASHASALLQLVIKHIKLHVSRPQTQLPANWSHTASDDPTTVNKHLD